MPERTDHDPTAPPPGDEGLTRTFLPPTSAGADVPGDERHTLPRLTGGSAGGDSVPGCVGRFPVRGEVGRGGMGLVLEADDPQLGRPLAVKLLLERHQNDPVLVRRFLDEARICARLQHPGIVPVHELGRLPDRRPFFTMKLIRGRTLASLLQARRDPADDLPHFLTIFEQVCQTMAYAHANGVIHRDLKPSNVMVGNFGEVQVMDWGLAKVLSPQAGPPERPGQTADPTAAMPERPTPVADSATSQAGAVMGTPAFMAPEQARGALDEIDTRCDVFGLGALLCVILTGRPPYDAPTYAEALRRAVGADLSAAHAALAACPADAELVGLARQCLSADPKDRPADAGVVALAMTEYRASVAERLHDAEMERAAAQARAVAERKAHRLTLALAGAVIALLLVGGGGWYWLQQERGQRRALTARAAEEHLQRALRLREQGRAEPAGEMTSWDEALAAAREAVNRLGGADADPALRRRAEELLAGLETEVHDRRMLARLEQVRLRRSEVKGNQFDLKGAASAYADAFRAYGLDVEKLPDEQAAERLRGRAIVAELAGALDDWAEACGDAAVRRRLLGIAGRADADPWRRRLRTALAARDRDALADAARSGAVDSLPPASLYLLGQALADVGDAVEAVRLLRRGQRLHPEDFWLNFQLALLLETGTPPQHAEAVRFYTAALAVRKGSAGVHLSLGNALRGRGDLDEAIAAYREALRLRPDYPMAHYNLANTLNAKGRREEAVAEYREALRLMPDYVEAYNNMGNVLGDLGRTGEAVDAYRRAIRLKPDHASAHHNLAIALLRQGKLDEALAACEQAVQLRGDASFFNTLGLILDGKKLTDRAIDAYRKAIELDRTYAQPHYNLGQLYLREGRAREGNAAMQEYLRLRPRDAAAWYKLGKSRLGQGDADGAIAALRDAVGSDPGRGEAWTALGWAYELKGDLNSAIDALRKAVELRPDDPEAHNDLGTCLAERGRLAEAIRCFRTTVRLKPEHASAYNNLGNALGAQGEPAAAVAAYRTAVRLRPDYVLALRNRAQTLAQWGKLDEAVAACRDALDIEPDEPFVNCLLGLYLQEQGKLTPARDALRRGHELGVRQKGWNRPSQRWLARCRRLIELDKKLPAVRRGEAQPADADERLELAQLCLQAHPWYADAARLYREALAERPALAEDTAQAHRYRAACAAALAGCGRGEGADKLTDAERAAWRKQALDWLRADLELLRGRADGGSEVLRGNVRKKLRRWQDEPALAGLRDAAAVGKLPPREQPACRRLWDDVNKVLEATAPPP